MVDNFVVLAPGPIHLFWTGAVYYLWELSKKYRVILIVDEKYAENDDFNKVIRLADVPEVLYLPSRGIIRRHLFYATKFKALVKKYNPRYIFHHDSVYVSMMYLYHWGWSNKNKAVCISYLSGVCELNWEKGTKCIREHLISGFVSRYKISHIVAKMALIAYSRISIFINYYLFPAILIRKIFPPPLNVITFEITNNSWSDKYNYFLLYEDVDRDALVKLFRSESGIAMITHPMKTVCDELHAYLYGSTEEDKVVILPSYGILEKYKHENNLSDSQVIDLIKPKWVEIIDILHGKYKNYKFFIKLHPSQSKDIIWITLLKEIESLYKQIVILDPSDNAQKIILNCKVIVGEVSCALWWASHFTSKTTISLNVVGLVNQDELKCRKNIFYYDTMEKFKLSHNHNLSTLNNKCLPTLNQFLDDLGHL